jgi:alpha-tubulin suppressor-like RCC1 family protein
VSNGTAPDATSSATLTVTTGDVAASITQQPANASTVAGGSAVFSVGVAGTPTPSVTWQTSTDGVTWTDAGSGTTLTISGAALAQNGLRVRAVVSNTIATPAGPQPNTVTSSEATLTVVSNLPPNALLATQVITVSNRTLALHPDGRVFAWGAYVDPLSGGYTVNGSWAQQPTRVQGLGPVRQVAIGSDYASWALAADGTVWGWGFLNSYEAFAQGPNNTMLQFPAPVQLLEATNTPIDRVCQIEGTMYGVVMVRSEVIGGTCAANEPRSVWYTSNISGNEGTSVRFAVRYGLLDSGGALLPMGRWIKEIVTSRNSTVGPSSVFAIANDGSVYTWGYLNGQGQLGLGNSNTQPTTPQLAPGWQGAVRIAASAEATLALMPDGSIRGAGRNSGASLGIGPVSFDTVSTPTTLGGIAGASDVSTASSNPGSMALVGGQLRYWGNNPLFDPAVQTTPIAIAAPATPLTSVVVGGRIAVAIGPGNVVYSWGDAVFRGCALNATTCNSTTFVPTLVTVP